MKNILTDKVNQKSKTSLKLHGQIIKGNNFKTQIKVNKQYSADYFHCKIINLWKGFLSMQSLLVKSKTHSWKASDGKKIMVVFGLLGRMTSQLFHPIVKNLQFFLFVYYSLLFCRLMQHIKIIKINIAPQRFPATLTGGNSQSSPSHSCLRVVSKRGDKAAKTLYGAWEAFSNSSCA